MKHIKFFLVLVFCRNRKGLELLSTTFVDKLVKKGFFGVHAP